jgi:hypothetical protein
VRSLLLAVAGVCSLALLPASALAGGPALATFGASWDGPSHDLQHIVDAYTGVPGALNVQSDYVGAHDGDVDWVGTSIPALLITEVAGNADTNELGWYLEDGLPPRLDGVHDGVVFSGPQGSGSTAIVLFPNSTTKFGFYLDTHTQITTPTGQRDRVFYTNRHYNDAGLNGYGAIRAPFDGDIQALVFDVSRWKGPNMWLVAFEDLDAGGPITPCCTGTDDDYNDLVFQISALGATPTATVSFGALKARYR